MPGNGKVIGERSSNDTNGFQLLSLCASLKNVKNNIVQGLVKRHPDGFGFILPDSPEDPDLYVSRKNMKGLMTNDRVQAEARPEKDGERFFAKKIKVLSRGTTKGVGIITFPRPGEASVEGSFEKWGQALTLDIEEGPRVKPGDLVSFRFVQYEDPLVAVLEEVIGDPEDPMNDISRVLLEKGIPMEFSGECLAQANAFPEQVNFSGKGSRKDLRDLCFITIDGVTAKDFDDGIYVESLEKKGFRLWVAIADVSHYVRPGDSIDKDAVDRGTSVYLPNVCVPMLPESLSNELCSLKPHVDRFAFVCQMDIGFDGQLIKKTVYEAVIQSKARVTYGEAQDFLNDEGSLLTKEVESTVKLASDVAKILMKKRYREGALNLEVPETEVIVDEQGLPVDLVRSERVFAHKLIEELMLIANVAVAQLINEKEAPGLYRVHESPDVEDIGKVQMFMSQFGGKTRLKGGLLQKKLSQALDELKGQPSWAILNILILRSMNQAQYSPANIGHFGLGFENYSHFTSPIRRYPDLITHRILKALYGSGSSGYLYKDDELMTFGSTLSALEQRAVKAERLVKSIKKARFMEDKVGETYEGTISSVARFGVFVLLKAFDVDGLVKLEDLGNDYFDFDEEQLILRGKKTKLTYRLGDRLSVQVAGVHTDEGKIDFVLAARGGEGRDDNGTRSASFKKDRARPRRKKSKPTKSNRKQLSQEATTEDSSRRKGRGRKSSENRVKEKRKGKSKKSVKKKGQSASSKGERGSGHDGGLTAGKKSNRKPSRKKSQKSQKSKKARVEKKASVKKQTKAAKRKNKESDNDESSSFAFGLFRKKKKKKKSSQKSKSKGKSRSRFSLKTSYRK